MHSIGQEVNIRNSVLLYSNVWARKNLLWFSLQPHEMRGKVSYFSFGMKKLNGLRVDLWGDGCEIGDVKTTRIALRIYT